MKIKNHRLYNDDDTAARFVRSPNQSGTITPKYLVMHYTAAVKASGSINWLADPRAKASAHLVIDRDGSVTQMVAFNKKAWHAGVSSWDGISGLNSHSIGIELANAGKLKKSGSGWASQYGTAIPDSDVVMATHKLETQEAAWHDFPEAQLSAALEIATLLFDRYGLIEVIGHDDIAPTRKRDPGPAFPMGRFASQLEGRDADSPTVYRTTTALNIRTGPGTGNDKLPASPLPSGTRLDVDERSGKWLRVLVMDTINGDMDIEGWVHGNYVERA